jgi:crotonobetainyl-CoA:carnitine CoA-transferase CaiB-like acyl-CoA transferase
MPVNDLAALLDDPQLAASGFFESYDHPSEGRLKGTRFPVQFSDMPDRQPATAPRVGEHSRAVLDRLGYDADAIADLLAAGVVIAP